MDAEEVNCCRVGLGCFSFFCFNIPNLVLPNPYEKSLDKLIDYIELVNRQTYNKVGVHIRDPMEYSMRLVF